LALFVDCVGVQRLSDLSRGVVVCLEGV